jgi:hypothetical protein
MVTVAHTLSATGSMAQAIDPRQQTRLPDDSGPLGWAQAVQSRLARLLASGAGADDVAGAQADESSLEAEDLAAAARLEGVQLAAREIAHLVNNDLAVTVGTLDLPRSRGGLHPQALELLERALAGASAAARHVDRLQRVQRVVTRETPAGPSLDLDRSV